MSSWRTIRRSHVSTMRAIQELERHRLRTSLAFLGLIAGVSSVILVLAIAEGAGIERQRQLAHRGADQIVIQGPTPEVLAEIRENRPPSAAAYSPGLTIDDVRRINKAIPDLAAINPIRESWGKAHYRDQDVDARLIEVEPGYFPLTRQQLAQGQWLTDHDARSARRVAVIGQGLAQSLLPGRSPIGESIDFHEILDELPDQSLKNGQPPGKSLPCVVVGVTTSGKNSSPVGRDPDLQPYAADIAIALEVESSRNSETAANPTATRVAGLTQITVTVKDVANVRATANSIDNTLKQSHTAAEYAISLSEALLAEADTARRSQHLFLATVAATMLTIGGMGIMTIMLASVSERTREIGLRRAMGARRRDIARQFLFEAGLICCLGAAIGVLVGLMLLAIYVEMSGIPVRVRLWSPVVASGFAVTIGVLFGVYPAIRAARIEPADALRWSD